jgi:hypothetical protein
VEICWKNRHTSCGPIVVQNVPAVLPETLPLEGMHLIVHQLEEKVVDTHSDEPVYYIL